ncbi:hypothetical protein BIV57_17145 [Mangrovactinospora gilvigrisea]|uniref:1-phosphatidylinositol phosphodiesterase n=1 Tax=Mangrovactinospora gilvigrisea TaxID=1428644 RepID=A0A1J7C427_9ACTN|nr:phosphatidylinositol-specific phospholipase C [Mangrovactinospora gilvigrisea]OIV36304.1 hypothetical protein BIV57_17145 [Mangrovactinospora gilvigrisea]
MTRRGFVRTAGAAAVAAAVTAAGATTASAAAAPPDPASWMAALPGATPLQALTVPGTHDTCATNPANGTEWSHCQNMGVPEQLSRGIRFLDVRGGAPVSSTPGDLGIYHSEWYQGITLDTVLDQCRTFLASSAGRGETILMRLKNEHGLTDAQFAAAFDGYLGAKGYRGLFRIGDKVPRLDEARGRIVLLTEFANTLGALDWPAGDNGVFANAWCSLQDRYQTSVHDKIAAVKTQCAAALAAPHDDRLLVNFTSLASCVEDGFLWPKTLADLVMPNIRGYLQGLADPSTRLGVVPMDFPERYEPIIGTLIARNFAG